MSPKHYITHTILFPLWVVNTDSSFIPIIIIILGEDFTPEIILRTSSNDVCSAVAEAFISGGFLWGGEGGGCQGTEVAVLLRRGCIC